MSLLPVAQVAEQYVNFTAATGEIVPVSVSALDQTRRVLLNGGMVFSAEAALSFLMILVVAITTKPEKRKTFIFLTNNFTLAACAIRGILQTQYYVGGWSSVIVQLGLDFRTLHTSDYRNSEAAAVLPIFIIMFCELSLLFQARVVYSSSRKAQNIVTVFSTILSVVTTAFWILSSVLNCLTIEQKIKAGSASLWGAPWYYQTARLLFSFSICVYSALLIYKLFTAIRMRRKMGLRQFGPMQVILIMSCQTLIIPALFTIVDFAVKYNGFASIAQCLVAYSLPLSSIWANKQAEQERERKSMMQSAPKKAFPRAESPVSPNSAKSFLTKSPKYTSTSEVQPEPRSDRSSIEMSFPGSMAGSNRFVSPTSANSKAGWV